MEGFEQRSGADRLIFEKSGSGSCVEWRGGRGEPPSGGYCSILVSDHRGLEQSCGSGLG